MTRPDDEVEEAGRAHLVRRVRIALWLVVVSTLAFALTDLRLPPAVMAQAFAIKIAHLGIAFAALWWLRRPRSHRAVTVVALAVAGATCVLVAISGWVTSDLSSTLVLCLAITWGTATLLPIGPRAQAGVAAVAGAAMALNVWLVRGDLVHLTADATYPVLAAAITLAASIWLAYERRWQRVLLAAERRERGNAERELRAARDDLDRRVHERTRELEERNRQLAEAGDALRATEGALAEQSRFVSAVLDTVGALISVVDRDGRIVRLNQAWEKLFGRSLDDLHGRLFWELLPAREVEASRRFFAELIDGTRPPRYDAAWAMPTGERRLLAWSVTFLRDAAGAVEYVVGTGIDITERTQAQEALRRSEEHWRALIEHSTDLIGVLGADARIRYISPSIRRLLAAEPSDWIGRSALELIHPDDVAAVVEALQAGIEHRDTGEPLFFRIRHGDGSWRTFEGVDNNLIGVPAVDGIVVNLRDVTERREAEEALAVLNEDLELRVSERTAQLAAANRELESFSYTVSHDLRTPLRHIREFARIMTEDHAGELGAVGRQYLGRIVNAAQHMHELVEALLALARLGLAHLHIRPVDLGALANEILAELRRGEPLRAVETRVAPGLVVYGDAQLLRIVMDNLLANAWKYTARRELAHIEVGRDERDGRTIYFVQDDGAGFDMKYADRLFVPFQRLHDRRDFEGTGVGLATVQRIVTRHAGEVWVEAEVGKGARVSFTVGTRPADAAARRRRGARRTSEPALPP